MKNANLDRIVSRVFLWGLPLVVVAAIGNSFINEDAIANQPAIIQALHGLAGLIFGLWMAFALFLSARLVFSNDIRTEILPKLVSFKERDEREALLTGNATKKSFLTTLAILILLLCLSVFQVSLYQVPPEKAVNGKSKTITLGLGLGLIDDAAKSQKPIPSDVRRVFINYTGLPFSKSAVILFLIIWQVVAPQPSGSIISKSATVIPLQNFSPPLKRIGTIFFQAWFQTLDLPRGVKSAFPTR